MEPLHPGGLRGGSREAGHHHPPERSRRGHPHLHDRYDSSVIRAQSDHESGVVILIISLDLRTKQPELCRFHGTFVINRQSSDVLFSLMCCLAALFCTSSSGQEEIEATCYALAERFEQMRTTGQTIPEMMLLPIYSTLPSDLQANPRESIFSDLSLGLYLANNAIALGSHAAMSYMKQGHTSTYPFL